MNPYIIPYTVVALLVFGFHAGFFCLTIYKSEKRKRVAHYIVQLLLAFLIGAFWIVTLPMEAGAVVSRVGVEKDE